MIICSNIFENVSDIESGRKLDIESIGKAEYSKCKKCKLESCFRAEKNADYYFYNFIRFDVVNYFFNLFGNTKLL